MPLLCGEISGAFVSPPPTRRLATPWVYSWNTMVGSSALCRCGSGGESAEMKAEGNASFRRGWRPVFMTMAPMSTALERMTQALTGP